MLTNKWNQTARSGRGIQKQHILITDVFKRFGRNSKLKISVGLLQFLQCWFNAGVIDIDSTAVHPLCHAALLQFLQILADRNLGNLKFFTEFGDVDTISVPNQG